MPYIIWWPIWGNLGAGRQNERFGSYGALRWSGKLTLGGKKWNQIFIFPGRSALFGPGEHLTEEGKTCSRRPKVGLGMKHRPESFVDWVRSSYFVIL